MIIVRSENLNLPSEYVYIRTVFLKEARESCTVSGTGSDNLFHYNRSLISTFVSVIVNATIVMGFVPL